MAVNKVVVNDETMIDLTSDTVTASNLAEGITAHDAKGDTIVGSLSFNQIHTGSTEPSLTLGKDGDLYLKV